MKRPALRIALAAIFTALIAVFGLFPFVFLLPLLVASVITDFRTSIFLSIAFGVISLLYAFMYTTPVALAFVAFPFIPILGRIPIGAAARGIFLLARSAIKKDGKLKKILPPTLAAATGSIANTACVVTLLVIFAGNTPLGGVTMLAFVPAMLVSGIIELIVSVIAVPSIYMAIKSASNYGSTSSLRR